MKHTRTRTRILSLLLALMMCLGLLPVTALADDAFNRGNWEFRRVVFVDGKWTEVEEVHESDFYTGELDHYPSNSFKPDDPLVVSKVDEYIYWLTSMLRTDGSPIPAPSRTEETSFTLTLLLEYPDGTSKRETIPVWLYTRTWPSTAAVFDDYPRRFSVSDTDSDGFMGFQLREPAESFSGYVFDGWYAGDGTLKSGFVAASDASGADVTYVARWKSDDSSNPDIDDNKPNPDIDDNKPNPDAGKSREVWFHPNGGTAAKPSGYEYSDQDRDGATLSAMTDDDCKLPILPTATREGYTFDGWYTAQAGGTKVSAGTDLSVYQGNGGNHWADGQIVLWAHWTQASTGPHTVSFSWNGALFRGQDGYLMIGPDPITVEHGKPIPILARSEGMKGWAMEDGTVYNGQPVTADMTLYAIWDPPTKGIDPAVEDTYRFNNSSTFFSNYTVSENYLQLLFQDVPVPRQEEIRSFMESKWSGSCFGMSAVYAMSQGGQINLGLYQSGAERLWDLDKPKDRASVRDLINYYMLSQFTSSSRIYERGYRTLDITNRYRKIAQDLQGEKDFSVLCFSYSTGCHAIVAKSIAKGGDGNYHVSVWDPNYPLAEGELVISGSFSNAYFTDTTFDSAKYNINTELNFIMPLSTKNQSYDARSLTGTSTISTADPMAVLSLDVGTFTLAAADGRSATVIGGRQTGGELALIPFGIPMGENDTYQFYLDADALKGLTVSTSGGAGHVQLVSDDILARVNASGLKSVTVGEGSVSTVTDSAVQQKITLISEELGGYWDKVIASGKDTAISLKAKAGELTISAANSAAVTVQRESVVKQASGDKENVNATPEGVTISVSGQGNAPGTTAPSTEPGASPFTDVKPSDYYYDSVLWAVENGVTAGTGDGTTFSPGDTCTRAQIVTFLWRAYGEQKPSATENPFTDVKPSDYYYNAVLWAVEKGITAGTGDGTTFSPNDPCTRAQAVTFQWRAAGKPTVSGGGSFTDVASDSYYAGAVAWAVENSITAGTGNGTTFSPNDPCTRAQIVAFLYREMGK